MIDARHYFNFYSTEIRPRINHSRKPNIDVKTIVERSRLLTFDNIRGGSRCRVKQI